MRGRIAAVLVLLWIVPGSAGCAPTDIRWTEEVTLHDGRTIQVKRRTEKRDASIYRSLERTGARGLNERRALRGMCEKCKGIDIQTASAAEVFMPADRQACS